MEGALEQCHVSIRVPDVEIQQDFSYLTYEIRPINIITPTTTIGGSEPLTMKKTQLDLTGHQAGELCVKFGSSDYVLDKECLPPANPARQ